VQFRPGTDPGAQAAELPRAGHGARHVYRNVFPGVAVSMPDAAANAQRANPNVAFVEPDAAVTATGTQTAAPWGIDRVNQRSLPLSDSYTWDSAGATYVVAKSANVVAVRVLDCAGQRVWVYENGVRIASVAVSATATSVKVGDLKAGVPYRFMVTATTSTGTSPGSALSNQVVPTR
jgi:hypothetical protein